jgi:hypothetical protein
LHWWLRLGAEQEFEAVFGVPDVALGEFMALIRPLTLWYLADTDGWWMVAYTAPLFNGATYGLWARADCRGARGRAEFRGHRGLRFVLQTHDMALNQAAVLVNTCRDPEMARKTESLGYTRLGDCPNLAIDGGPMTVLYLTRAAFDARWPRERYS